MSESAFKGKVAWVSGHTGFKGAWLAEWLLLCGAKVIGFSQPPHTEPSLFEQLKLQGRLVHQIGDINDLSAVRQSLVEAQPDFVFHLSAQSLVRLSYRAPVETFSTNVMGTVHVLDALRDPIFKKKGCVAVMITTDKVYENRETFQAYREDDPLGGHDPYSASKAAAEMAIMSYRKSFWSPANAVPHVKVVSVRAGNVIGGGDWAMDRIVPDAFRALFAGKTIQVRNPGATRPWQHVVEPLSGYMLLAERLAAVHDLKHYHELASPFNFGPDNSSNRSVQDLVEEILKTWKEGKWHHEVVNGAVHEATRLHLANYKACELLGWRPKWDFETTLLKTVEWYRMAQKRPQELAELTRQQIQDYTAA